MGLQDPFGDASPQAGTDNKAADAFMAARRIAETALQAMTDTILPVDGRFFSLEPSPDELVVYLHAVDDSEDDRPDHQTGSRTPVLGITLFNSAEIALLSPGDKGTQGMTRLWVGVPGAEFQLRLWEQVEQSQLLHTEERQALQQKKFTPSARDIEAWGKLEL